jgi:hypothetical protein
MPPAGAQDADPAATERHLSARPDAQPQLPPAQRQRALIKWAIIATQRVVCSLDAPMVRVLETRSEDAQRMGRGGLVGPEPDDWLVASLSPTSAGTHQRAARAPRFTRFCR